METSIAQSSWISSLQLKIGVVDNLITLVLASVKRKYLISSQRKPLLHARIAML